MPRLPELRREELSPEQAALYESIAATRGPDIALKGPFGVWLYNPTLGDAAQRLGEQIRYHSSLPPRLLELAILVCARRWQAEFEWHVHAPLARAAGLGEEVLEAIAEGRVLAAAGHEEKTVYEFTRSLLQTSRVPEDIYQAAAEILGRRGVVELITAVGYYTLVAMTLNAFETQSA